ncbi:MAG: OmpA family protein, partial [Elusimicrobia bacterium]|nr:OmpA family protein [Elusimicrobiota bacterium]
AEEKRAQEAAAHAAASKTAVPAPGSKVLSEAEIAELGGIPAAVEPAQTSSVAPVVLPEAPSNVYSVTLGSAGVTSRSEPEMASQVGDSALTAPSPYSAATSSGASTVEPSGAFPLPPMPGIPGQTAVAASTSSLPDAAIQSKVDADAMAKAAENAAAAAQDKIQNSDVSGAVLPAGAAAAQQLTEQEERDRVRWLEQVAQKVAALRKNATDDLQKTSGVTLALTPEGLPEAIGLAPDALFEKDSVKYKPGAAATLLRVVSLLFTVGKANLVLLPEGTMTGNLGMLDMRRTMAINSWLAHRGIAPARLKANLTAVINKNFPDAFSKISGIGIVFDYSGDKNLAQSAPEQGAPPLLSLGIYPSEIDVSKGEGALIEISVVETSAQVASWELQMLSGEGGKTVSVVKSISGTGPVYTQTYWNGRGRGQVVAPGQYACILTATDALGARISIKTFVNIVGPVVKAPVSASKKTELKAPPTTNEKQYKEYFVSFSARSPKLYKQGIAGVKEVVKGIKTMPLSRVVVTGYAAADETESNPAKLALRRAQAVSAVLRKEYGVSADRVEVKSRVTQTAKPVAKVALVGGGR